MQDCILLQVGTQSTANGQIVRIGFGTVCNACSLLHKLVIAGLDVQECAEAVVVPERSAELGCWQVKVLLEKMLMVPVFVARSHLLQRAAFAKELAVHAFVPETVQDSRRMHWMAIDVKMHSAETCLKTN